MNLEKTRVISIIALNILIILFLSAGCNSNKKLSQSDIELIDAATKGNLEKADSLLKAGANPNAAEEGRVTPLRQACYNDHTEIAKLLIDYGADVNKKTEIGTPLMAAALSGNSNIVDYLIEHGAKVNLKSKFGTPIIGAALSGNVAIVRILIEKGAKINIQDNEGWTALMCAVCQNSYDTVKLLIEEGVKVNLKNSTGTTALELAIDTRSRGIKGLFNSGKIYSDIISALIDAGANIDIVTFDGKTHLQVF